ncbi:DUF6314 family protein [Streptomyces tsukubensis]|uniref:DUF6314 domain-containing protein n=1 Tax=Streptomyces tsukubensis TaxID=83656 RepID=A0A1V4AF48_9ACTN|nr:DUF6314 family protein [Streptomyces tsukubensis]OON82191.1 hypothetical protein B1H18_03895 [Streptomyces tsukubensis]QFR92678.1 hypothetical protein GBW32_05920 [Streptomyces tsukubensis]
MQPTDTSLHPVPDALLYLAGRWQVLRTAQDLAGGMDGTFTGTTDFSDLPPHDDEGDEGGGGDGGTEVDKGAGGLSHHESGAFTWNGVTRPAERTLRYLQASAAGTVRVEFAHGGFFHDLDLRTGHYVADHPCSLDMYRGEFTVLGPDRWRTVWRVAGPAKDLVLTTEYRRDRARR